MPKRNNTLGVELTNARVRVGGTSAFTSFFFFLNGGGSPALRASMRAGKKEGGLGEGIFARPQFCVSKILMAQQFSLKNVRAFLWRDSHVVRGWRLASRGHAFCQSNRTF